MPYSRRSRNPTWSALLTLLFMASLSRASPSPQPSPSPHASPSIASTTASILAGDAAYRERKDEAKARLALAEYRAAHASAPGDPEAGYRLGMACYFVGLRLTHDSDAKEKIFAEGRDAALDAAEKSPGCAACHFWGAINKALYGQEVGVFKMLFSLKDVENHLRRSIEIDPRYASAGGYRLLGVIREKLPSILGGSKREAREFYLKAIELAPDEPLNYLFLARLLRDRFDNPEGAIAAARKGISIKDLPSERLESIESRSELEEWLQKHGNERSQ
jgi:tetratricopeptide (TPR) repeat protein